MNYLKYRAKSASILLALHIMGCRGQRHSGCTLPFVGIEKGWEPYINLHNFLKLLSTLLLSWGEKLFKVIPLDTTQVPP